MNAKQFITIFISKIKNKNDLKDEEITSIVSNIIHPKKYININKKRLIVENIILQTVEQDENLSLKYNSFDKYLITIINLINLYTDLDIDEEGYDILCGNNALQYVLSSFANEYEIFMGIMNLYMDNLTSHTLLLSDINGGDYHG